MPRLFAVIALLAVVGSLLYSAVAVTKKLVVPWREPVATGV